MKENLRTILRCTGLAFAVAAALVLLPANAQAQAHTTGFDIAKDCPIDPIDQGATATCTFSVTNNDVDHGVENLAVTNQFPFPGGTTTPGVCLQGGVAVTTLGAAGTATDTCTGSFDETAPISCEDTDTAILQDEIRANGLDCGPQCGVTDPGDPFEGLPVSGATTNVIRVNPLVCPTAPECQDAVCTPGVGCGTVNEPNSTPCGTDTDGNDCTAPGCAAGVCVQNHILDAPSTPCGTDTTPNDCTTPGCTAEGVCSQTHNNAADSTPCGTDTDNNDCTAPGCAAGQCLQNHILDAPSTPCGTDSTPDDCTTPGCTAEGICSQTHNNVADSTPCGPDTGNECATPGCVAGVCDQGHIPVADSTPCGTDNDGNDCTAPGCAAGSCVQNHILDAPSTPCGTDSDTTDCTTPGCTAEGVCSQTHNNVADSTPCGTDTNTQDCTTPGCVGGVCDQTHIDVADSTPCGTDTDGLTCTTPGCEAGACVQTHVEDCGVLICRTPGFWGTHYDAGEKDRAPDVTCGVLNAYNAANDPDLEICGTTINNCEAGNPNSALEAICVAVKGDSRRQLARQLMAAALNCIVSSSTGNPETECPPDPGLAGGACEGVSSIDAIFEACNAACPTGVVAQDVDLDGNPNTPAVDINCIDAIDCFNNGFVVDPETGECTGESSGCHELQLVNGCFDFQPPGPAGSPKECNAARKNDIDVVPDLP